MFEQAVIAHPIAASRKQLVLLPVSVALHSALILSALFATIWRIEFPRQTPSQIQSFSVAAPLPPLAAAPPPLTDRRTARVIPRQAVVTPQVVPQTVPIPEPEPVTGGVPDGSDVGIPGGQPGGVPGGVADGVVGGFPVEGPLPFQEAPLPVGGEVLPPTIIYKVSPVYPAAAHRIGLQGTVIVQAIIDRSGQLRNVVVLQSTSAIFNEPALAAVQQWRFRPGSLRNRPVDTIFELKILFKLSGR